MKETRGTDGKISIKKGRYKHELEWRKMILRNFVRYRTSFYVKRKD